MSRYTDHSFVDAVHEARPEIARALIEAADGLGADHQDPMVLASTSDGFRVRNDVLAASGLQDPEPGAEGSPAGSGESQQPESSGGGSGPDSDSTSDDQSDDASKTGGKSRARGSRSRP
jgi:hypothetical protein